MKSFIFDRPILCNRLAAQKLGLTTATLLIELLSVEDHNRNKLISHEKFGDGWFYANVDKIIDNIGLTKKECDASLKKLNSLGLIDNAMFGKPINRYFKIYKDKVKEYLLSDSSDRDLGLKIHGGAK